ncbi:helix-turn-helix transcriptional regulator [Nocardioides sp. ChNu-99]|nr:helix-turn-helix transcriptional regulator [Nocardioides sp. ChNu-99]
MLLKDRKQLAKLMVIQGVSARQLAKVAGWRSHSYMNRLLAGQVRSLSTDPALRIANHLGVGVDDLFLVRVSNDAGRNVQQPQRKAS